MGTENNPFAFCLAAGREAAVNNVHGTGEAPVVDGGFPCLLPAGCAECVHSKMINIRVRLESPPEPPHLSLSCADKSSDGRAKAGRISPLFRVESFPTVLFTSATPQRREQSRFFRISSYLKCAYFLQKQKKRPIRCAESSEPALDINKQMMQIFNSIGVMLIRPGRSFCPCPHGCAAAQIICSVILQLERNRCIMAS